MSEPNADPFDLNRFVNAQSETYDRALAEIRHGRKTSHWMWFIFPQVIGLGNSEMSRRYAVHSLEEARAYLGHPILGSRLRECSEVLLSLEGRTANEIFGSPDDMKLRSSMTLFDAVGEDTIFFEVLDKYFSDLGDPRTLRILTRDATDA